VPVYRATAPGYASPVARVDVSTSSDLSPDSDWMTIFAGWRGPVPSKVEKGTRVSSCIKVKGFRNVIRWTVTRYDGPKAIELSGAPPWRDPGCGSDDGHRQPSRVDL
jgi:hypothetical protein